jgi:hypothetical protein
MFRLIIILPTIILSTVLTARTIVVGKDQPITSIRKAIDLAKEKDTILVKPGVYKEGNIVMILLTWSKLPGVMEKRNLRYCCNWCQYHDQGFQLQNCGNQP